MNESRPNSGAHIASIATATPPRAVSQDALEQLARKHYQGRLSSRSMSLIHALFSHPSIKQRNLAIDDVEDLVDEDVDARVARFTKWSQDLSAQAINGALERAGLGVADVDGLVVNTCTGYICPGISTYLIGKLGLSRSVRVYDLVGSGCGGAIPNLEIAESLLVRKGKGVVVSVAVEICTATFQMDNDLSLLLSNTLFGDGAAAAVLWTKPEGYELVASASQYVPEQREHIRYVHKKGQLHNQLSLRLPDLIKKAAAQVVSDVLEPLSLTPRDIKHWALHSGGEKVINALRDELGLSEDQVSATRHILAEHGNMSSPTVWFVLRELEKRGIASGDWCIMVAFGAGLSAHAYLLRKK
ncbi:MAG: type III polyketide synthase [Nitrospiraceae bacterium]|nr:type III polyketide synthase [Nitrospiraceae bacterium]